MTEETLFHEMLAKPAWERTAFLDAACAGQPQLRAAVAALLEAHEASASLLDEPPAGLSETIGPESRPAQALPSSEFSPQASAYQPPLAKPGLVIAGRYTLLEKIGEGGMAQVWVAKQSEPVKRKVALKLIKAGMNSGLMLVRFEQERQALALMDHPHIARVFDGGLAGDGLPFFAMELVNGLPLTRFCDEAKLSPRQRLELFVPICQAVQHAHQKGIVHRDLKPSNILVTLIDGKPTPRVIDFGVAKATAGKLTDESLSTQFGAVVGTLGYMAPEQAGYSGADIDTRADIYSLGVILYELLTGLRPLDARRLEQAALTEMVRILNEEEPAPPSARLSTAESLPSLAALRQTEPKHLLALLRGELDCVVMKCLEKQRDRRYETASDLARDIQHYLADEPVEARPPSRGYRLKKLLRRHKGPVLAAGLVLLALVAGMVGTTFGMLRAEQRRIEAEEARRRETEQRTQAEQARDRTRQALDAMTSSATGDSLTTQKDISQEQKKFLREVLTYYQEFAGENAKDEAARTRTASAALRVGFLENRLGRKEEAMKAFRRAGAAYEQLVADFPGVPGHRWNLAISLNGQGLLLASLGKRDESVKQHQQALAIREQLVAEFPSLPRYRHGVALSHNNLGNMLSDQGERAPAEQHYRQALAIQEKLVGECPDIPLYRQELAGSHNNLGILLRDLGNYAQAQEECRQAAAIQVKLAAEFPTEPEYREELANSHNSLGLFLEEQGKRFEAEEQYHQALAIQVKLTADYPAVPEYRLDLAGSQHNLGMVLTKLDKPVEAEKCYRQALAIEAKLTADFPTVPEYRRRLAASHNSLGLLLQALGQQAGAEEQFRKALAIQEQLAAEFPAMPDYQMDLGGTYHNYGSLLRSSGQPEASLEWFAKGIRIVTAVYEQDRRLVMARMSLRKSHVGRAVAQDDLHRYAEAIQDWDKAIKFATPQEQSTLRIGRAASRVQAGQLVDAVAEIDELTRDAVLPAPAWYNCACVYALASGKSVDKRDECACRAIALLHKAVKAGYQDAAHMRKDTDLDSLRGREDFKRLLQELATKSSDRSEE